MSGPKQILALTPNRMSRLRGILKACASDLEGRANSAHAAELLDSVQGLPRTDVPVLLTLTEAEVMRTAANLAPATATFRTASHARRVAMRRATEKISDAIAVRTATSRT